MKRLLLLVPMLALAGCGTFKLFTSLGPAPPDKTTDQITLDTLVCKDKARTESQTAGDQARGFLLGFGLGLLGAAIDYDQQKRDQRRIFRDCMDAKGYDVVMSTD